MDAITYSAARANLASTMDRVCNDHEALIITRNGQQSVVMLSLEDFQAMEETAYLLRVDASGQRVTKECLSPAPPDYEGSACKGLDINDEKRELTPREQPSEVSIEGNQVLAELSYC